MNRVPVESSNMESVGYDPESHTLEVAFRDSGTYQYFDVPASVHDALMGAASKGSYFAGNIRGVFRYARV